MDEQETGMRSKIWNGGAGERKPLKSEKMIYIGTRNTESKDKIEERGYTKHGGTCAHLCIRPQPCLLGLRNDMDLDLHERCGSVSWVSKFPKTRSREEKVIPQNTSIISKKLNFYLIGLALFFYFLVFFWVLQPPTPQGSGSGILKSREQDPEH